MSDDTVDKGSVLHAAAREYLLGTGYAERPELGPATSFGDLLAQVRAAEAEGAPELTKVERLSLLRVSQDYADIESDEPFARKAAALVRAVLNREPPEKGDTLEERGLDLARRAVAEVAEHVSAPEDEGTGRARLVHGVLDSEGAPSAGSAAEVGALHIEALADAVHVVEQHYGFQFVVLFDETGRASIAYWPEGGAPKDLGTRAEVELTEGVTLQVVGGEQPELLFMGEEDGVRVFGPQNSVAIMRAEEYPMWRNTHDPAERSFKLSEEAMHFFETTPAAGDAKTAP